MSVRYVPPSSSSLSPTSGDGPGWSAADRRQMLSRPTYFLSVMVSTRTKKSFSPTFITYHEDFRATGTGKDIASRVTSRNVYLARGRGFVGSNVPRCFESL